MDQQELNSQTFDKYDFNIKAIFAFNPNAKPSCPKPQESDIQDAKLIFYHPKHIIIEEQRNQVGMAEGIFLFTDAFTPQQKQEQEQDKKKFQTIHLIEQTYCIYKESDDLYFFFSFTHENYQKINTSTEQYYHESCHQIHVQSNLDLFREVCQNFIASFQLWNGDLSNLGQQALTFIPRWIQLYSRSNGQTLNFLMFQCQQFRYAPLDNSLFLTLQYLKSMLNQLEPAIKDILMFYNGYFIYSSLDHKLSAQFKDHYYSTGVPFTINDQKIQQKFKIHEINSSDNALMNFVNLKNISTWTSNDIRPQKVYIPTLKNKTQEFDYFTYLDKNFLLILLLKPNNNQENQYPKLKEIHICVSKNIEKITNKLDYHIDIANQKMDQIRFFYYNGMNLAFKVSSTIKVNTISSEYMKIIIEINQKLLNSQSNIKQIQRIGGMWFIGIKYLGRCLIMILPTNISMSKIEEELTKGLDYQFPSLFI